MDFDMDDDFVIPETEDFSWFVHDDDNNIPTSYSVRPFRSGPPETMLDTEIDLVTSELETKMKMNQDHLMNFTDLLFTRTPAVIYTENRNAEYAQALLERVMRQRQDSTEFALVYDIFSADYSQRFLAQNAHSVELFGCVVAGACTQPRLLSRASEMRIIVTCCGAAYLNPGREFKIPCHYMCVGGTERAFDATFVVDPASFLMLRMGKLIE